MKHSFEDIRDSIPEEPSWYDFNGTPRYGRFHPDMCPDIYTRHVVYMRIECQCCRKEFLVEMHTGFWEPHTKLPPKEWHYGDPPWHGCTGDTMNCTDVEVMEVWKRDLGDTNSWVRYKELEGMVE